MKLRLCLLTSGTAALSLILGCGGAARAQHTIVIGGPQEPGAENGPSPGTTAPGQGTLEAGAAKTPDNQATPQELRIRPEEIMVFGRYVGMMRGSVILEAAGFSLPNGKGQRFEKSRLKPISLGEKALWWNTAAEEPDCHLLDPKFLSAGMPLMIVGQDQGAEFVGRLWIPGGQECLPTPRTPVPPSLNADVLSPPNLGAGALAAPGGGRNGAGSGGWSGGGIQVEPPPPDVPFFGGVKEWVAASGLRVQKQFSVPSVGGRAARPGSTASDHPRGLALDFMVGRNAALGDTLALYFVTNAAAENVRYVIWKDTLWQGGAPVAWQAIPADYGRDVTRRHMDHVHVSYLAQPLNAGPWLAKGVLASRGNKR